MLFAPSVCIPALLLQSGIRTFYTIFREPMCFTRTLYQRRICELTAHHREFINTSRWY